MISPWTIYWITRLDPIWNTCMALVISGSLASFFLFLFTYLEDEFDEWKGVFYIALIIAIIGGIGALFIPTTQQAAAIYIIPKIANNEQVQQVPENALKLVNSKLQEWLQDSVAEKAEAKKQ